MDDFIVAVFSSLSLSVVVNGSFSEGSDNSMASVSTTPHIKSKHFIWDCLLTGPTVDFPVKHPSLIDNGCHMVLIRPDVVAQLGLPVFTLDQPETVDIAIFFSKAGINRSKRSLVQYVKIWPFSSDSIFHSRVVHTVICPGLCMPLIFSLPFLKLNDVICDHKQQMCIVKDKDLNYNLLHSIVQQKEIPKQLKL